MAAILSRQVLAVDIESDTRWHPEWCALAAAHELRACWSTPIVAPDGTVVGTFAVYWRQPGGPGPEHQMVIERMTHLAAVAISRKRSEDALGEVRSQLAHVARVATLGELTAAIAHEVNQPLGAMVNNANACLRWLAAGRVQEARESVALVAADGLRASDILARIRAMVEKSPPQKASLDVNDALREVITLAASQAAKHGVTIESRLTGDMPPVWADRVQVQQVVLNLLMNGIEAMADTPEGLRRITVASSGADGLTVQVSVHDRGAGVGPEQVERLFEAFYSTKPQGLGMGLAISRAIVQAHHGQLWVTRDPDCGATFHFTLPVLSGLRS